MIEKNRNLISGNCFVCNKYNCIKWNQIKTNLDLWVFLEQLGFLANRGLRMGHSEIRFQPYLLKVHLFIPSQSLFKKSSIFRQNNN